MFVSVQCGVVGAGPLQQRSSPLLRTNVVAAADSQICLVTWLASVVHPTHQHARVIQRVNVCMYENMVLRAVARMVPISMYTMCEPQCHRALGIVYILLSVGMTWMGQWTLVHLCAFGALLQPTTPRHSRSDGSCLHPQRSYRCHKGHWDDTTCCHAPPVRRSAFSSPNAHTRMPMCCETATRVTRRVIGTTPCTVYCAANHPAS